MGAGRCRLLPDPMVDPGPRNKASRIVTNPSLRLQLACHLSRTGAEQRAHPLTSRCHPDTIWPIFSTNMSPSVSEMEWAVRLSCQLKTLSELAESLTYRVLELEERLGAQEKEMSSLQGTSAELSASLSSGMEERMLETEDRLERIEDLLQGEVRRPSLARSLRALPICPEEDSAFTGDIEEEDPIFLDDLPAQNEHPTFEEDAQFIDDLHDQSLAS